MIRINLLPVRQLRKKKRLQLEVFGFCLLLALLGVSLGAYGLQLGMMVEGLKQEISQLNQQKALYSKIIAEIKQLDSKKNMLEKKIDVIRELKLSSQVSVRVLDELAAVTPSERLWLNNLQHSAGRLVISGVALDNATIAQYMTKLTSSPYFADADLANSTSTVVAGNRLQSFSLTIQIVNPEPAEQPTG
jgi:type IV pilus assembly protein PilN